MLLISHCESLNHSEPHIVGWIHSKTHLMKFQCGCAARLDDFMDYFLALWMNICVHATCFLRKKEKRASSD